MGQALAGVKETSGRFYVPLVVGATGTRPKLAKFGSTGTPAWSAEALWTSSGYPASYSMVDAVLKKGPALKHLWTSVHYGGVKSDFSAGPQPVTKGSTLNQINGIFFHAAQTIPRVAPSSIRTYKVTLSIGADQKTYQAAAIYYAKGTYIMADSVLVGLNDILLTTAGPVVPASEATASISWTPPTVDAPKPNTKWTSVPKTVAPECGDWDWLDEDHKIEYGISNYYQWGNVDDVYAKTAATLECKMSAGKCVRTNYSMGSKGELNFCHIWTHYLASGTDLNHADEIGDNGVRFQLAGISVCGTNDKLTVKAKASATNGTASGDVDVTYEGGSGAVTVAKSIENTVKFCQ